MPPRGRASRSRTELSADLRDEVEASRRVDEIELDARLPRGLDHLEQHREVFAFHPAAHVRFGLPFFDVLKREIALHPVRTPQATRTDPRHRFEVAEGIAQL